MPIAFDAPVTITPVTNIPNTWTDVATITPKVLGPVQVELTIDNEAAGGITDGVEIRFVSSDGVLGFSEDAIGEFERTPPDNAAYRVAGYVIPGVYRSVKLQARSTGPTDLYTVSGSYATIDVNA